MNYDDYAIGIDIGGTNTVLALVRKSGEIHFQTSFPTRNYAAYPDFLKQLCSVISDIIYQNGVQIAGIGIGAPNADCHNGVIANTPNLPFKGIFPLRSDLQRELSLPVFIANDANAAAMGERLFGGAVGMDNFFMVTLGTGLGSGIFVHGELLLGSDGFAGELGHVIVEENGRLCGCGRYGCLETYASATGLARTASLFLIQKRSQSSLLAESEDKLTAERVAWAANQGDLLAMEAFDFTAQKLALGLANAAAILSPQAIFLYGGLIGSGDLLLKPVQRYFEHFLFPAFKGKIVLQYSLLPKDAAALLGAAALVFSK